MARATILIADDDASIRKVIRFALEKADFDVVEAPNGVAALQLATGPEIALVVLDIAMPQMDGTDVCREVRKSSNVPILFLSSRDEELDKVLGLEMGGDDYMTKPFSPRELVARIRAILRRTEATDSADDATRHGRLTIDPDSYTAFWDDHSLSLTKSEFEILQRLLSTPGKVFRRNELMRGAVVSDRTIDSHVGHLRKKFEALDATPIETVHGVGYKLGSCS